MAAFVWGPGGQAMTPDQVKRLQQQADMAAARGANTGPIGHWSQGLARLVDAWGGYKGNQRADKAEAEGLASADSEIAALLGRPTFGGNPVPEPLAAAQSGGQFPASLIQSESGGNWSALNSEGYGGRLQFGADRLADAARAGVIPAGLTGAQFSQLSPAQQQAVESWHFGDIDQQAQRMGLDQYLGQNVGGVPITQDGIRAMAHLGGIGGAAKFLQSGGQYNPSDSNGTSLSDYARQHGGGGASTQVGASPQAGAGASMDIAALLQAQSNPWVAQKYGGVVNALIGQEMQRQNAAYDQQLRQQDPMYQAQLAKLTTPEPVDPWSGVQEINGQLVQMTQQGPQVIGDYREPMGAGGALPSEVQALKWRAEQAGLVPGTQEYQDFIMNGGNRGTGVPAGFAALDAQAKAGGLVPGTPEYQDFMLGGGAGERARASTTGKMMGEAQIELPASIEKASRAISNLEKIRDDPALPGITGMVQGRLPPMSQAGTDLNARIAQAQGQAFLEAFESLKGAGQITEIEGQKAEAAMARLNRAQSTEAYQGALNDLIDVLNAGTRRARQRAGLPEMGEPAAPPAAGGQAKRRRWSPDGGLQ